MMVYQKEVCCCGQHSCVCVDVAERKLWPDLDISRTSCCRVLFGSRDEGMVRDESGSERGSIIPS